MATYIAVKYMTCNDARPIVNTYKDIVLLLRVTQKAAEPQLGH